MKLWGTFKTHDNNEIEVTFKSNYVYRDVEIGGVGENVFFDGRCPVKIEADCENTFETVIKKSCTIRLISRIFIGPWVFATDPEEVTVCVKRNGVTIFSGFVVPATYSQGYAKDLETFDIKCVDYLSTLEDKSLIDGTTFAQEVLNSRVMTFREYIDRIFTNISKLDQDGGASLVVWDVSRFMPDGKSVWDNLAVTEEMFLGASEDDVYTYDEILKQLLQYLNLHIIQEGQSFYIFDWNSKRYPSTKLWYTVIGIGGSVQIKGKNIITGAEMYDSANTTVSMSEVYNQLALTCEIEEVENIIVNPLDSDMIDSPFNNVQLYMTELESKGTGASAWDGFGDLLKYNRTQYGGAKIVDWYFWIKTNDKWKFYYKGNDLYEQLLERDSSGNYINQHKFPLFLKQNRFAACLMATGKAQRPDVKDDSPVAVINMDDGLVISVNGNGDDSKATIDMYQRQINEAGTLAVYTGTTSGNYSPVDSSTTNYLVFSGKFALNPIMKKSGPEAYDNRANYKQAVEAYDQVEWYDKLYWIIPEVDGVEDGVYYQQKFWEQTNPVTTEPYWNYTNYREMIAPFTKTDGYEQLEYNFAVEENWTDIINKIPVIECELKIGDKYCVETYSDGEVKESVYGWYTEANLPIVDGKRKRTFTLGFNPKIGDKIVGKEWPIQTNFSYKTNIEASEGTAIPIKKSDNLIGNVSFKITGICNMTWNEVTQRTGSFWRSEKWTTETRSILSRLESIIIKDFECKVYTDNAGYANAGDNDLVYITNEPIGRAIKKDDIEFEIQSALTPQEAAELYVKNSINLSTVVDMSGDGVRDIKDVLRNETNRPERLYLNAYYDEYRKPRVIMETEWHMTDDISFFNNYTVGYLDKTFMPLTIGYDLINDRAAMMMKEINEN